MNIKDFRLWIFITILSSFFVFFLIQSTPHIVLIGKEVQTLEFGQKYKEYGAKVKWLLRDLPLQIKIKNEINEKKIGTYKVKYSK